jgi:hypothetical protein
MANKKPVGTIHLIVSDEEHPKVEIPSGKKLEVVGVTLITPKGAKAQVTAARLCSGGGTCQALFEAE